MWKLLITSLLVGVLFLSFQAAKRSGLFDALNEFATIYNQQYDLDENDENDEKQS